MRSVDPVVAATVPRPIRHQSFLVYDGFRYLKAAAALIALSVILYIADQPYGSAYGGSWAGYTLGTIGALLILWLTWFGYRKRTYDVNHGVLVGRLSAHVYLGLSLLAIGTLHTGFHFGWNVHTLAYALMLLVILSGVFGIFFYARYPRLMTENRQSTTLRQMMTRIATLNEELRGSAMTLDDRTAAFVERAIESTAIGGSFWRQCSGHYGNCATAAAIAEMDTNAASAAASMQHATRQVRILLDEKSRLLERVRRDLRFKAMMDLWLYFHVPLTFALLAALIAHIVAVFFLW